MKKTIFYILGLACLLTACDYDDSDLWNKVDDIEKRVKEIETLVARLNSEVGAVKTIVESSAGSKAVVDVTETSSGYVLTFSDGKSINIEHGRDGASGSDAPVIGIRKDIDGVWYWTITSGGATDWLTDAEGNKLPVTGEKGADGTPGDSGDNGTTPVLGVDGAGYWTVDYGSGSTRILDADGNAIKAAGDAGDSIFERIDTTDDGFVLFHLSNGEVLVIARSDATFRFVDSETPIFTPGETRELAMEIRNIIHAQPFGDLPAGWNATIDPGRSVAIITAPEDGEGLVSAMVTFMGLDTGANLLFAAILVEYKPTEIRVLTFEDEDYKGTGSAPYWTSLIDSPQYGGPLLYGDYINVDYHWYDEGNTYLASEIPASDWGAVYWGGGHAVSNYVEHDVAKGDFQTQLSVYYQDQTTGFGGRNGSKNFCVHYGYIDNSGYTDSTLPYIYFGDGIARVVDHMYVTITTYLLNCVQNGNSLTAPVGPDGYVRLVAIGYDADGREITEVTPKFEIANYQRTVIDWQKWDLSALGEVLMIKFNVEGDSDNGYGFSQPAYFAYDDVAVRF